MVEVNTGALLLEVSNNFAFGHSGQVSVILSIDLFLYVSGVKRFQVVHCNNQVQLRLLKFSHLALVPIYVVSEHRELHVLLREHILENLLRYGH